MRAAECVT